MKYWEGGQLRTWRWSSLVNVVRSLLKREQALRDGWNKDRFGDIGTTNTIHEALTSELFWKYSHFLNNVAGAVDLGSSFCEGCECHEHQGLKHNSYQVRRNEIVKRMRSAINDDCEEKLPYPPSCPLKNRRSAELASGAFTRFIQDTLDVTMELLQNFRGSLSDRDWQTILDDWMSARATSTKTTSFLFCLGCGVCSPVFSTHWENLVLWHMVQNLWHWWWCYVNCHCPEFMISGFHRFKSDH